MASPGPSSRTLQRSFSLIEPSKLEGRKLIGKGGFAKVYKAHHKDWGEVAVKVLINEEMPERDIKKLVGEAKKLWYMHYTNIITMFGVITKGEYSLVMEYTKYGCVLDFVQEHEVPMSIKVSIIHDIILGMNYLHTRDPAVIHCDLKAQNVLISEGFRAKICDFGISQWRTLSKMYASSTATNTDFNRGTMTHQCPEKWQDVNMTPTPAQDVYALGITVWEILAESAPYKYAHDVDQISHSIREQQRPDMDSIPDATPAWLTNDVMKASWQHDPACRPSFSELKKIIEKHNPKEELDLTKVKKKDDPVKGAHSISAQTNVGIQETLQPSWYSAALAEEAMEALDLNISFPGEKNFSLMMDDDDDNTPTTSPRTSPIQPSFSCEDLLKVNLKIGQQPNGTMTVKNMNKSVPGYEGAGTIQLDYSFPSGTQSNKHPKPGKPYKGTNRTAYLPDNPDGREVLRLLRKVFDARLLFKVGRSKTTNVDDCVIWHDVHHKTNVEGGVENYGYPDPLYLQRVKHELKVKIKTNKA